MSAFFCRLLVAFLASGLTFTNSIGAQVPRACGVGPTTFLTDSGIGKLRVGVSRAEIIRLCRVIRDTMVVNDDYVEMERVLVIDLGRDTVIAALGADTSISRIDVAHSRFRTRDGLRVGTSLRSLLNRWGLSAGIGEAAVQASVAAHCGLTLVLSGKGGGQQGDEFTRDQLAHWPRRIHVKRILVHGCRSGNAS
jgi:hypothetical protein